MYSLIKNLFKDSSVYALGDILTKGIGFLLLPIYTAYISPEEYGIVSIAIVIATIFGIIASLGLKASFLKFYFTFENEAERKEFYGSVWLIFIIFPSIFLLLLEWKGEEIFNFLLPEIGYDPYIRLSIWSIYLLIIFFDLPLQVFKARGEANKYTIVNSALFLVTTAFTIWFVVSKGQGAWGMIFSKYLGKFFLIAIGVYYLFKFITLKISLDYIKKALLYSFPLIPHYLSHWVLNSSDKLVLEHFLQISEVGIYNIGYTIGASLSIIAIAGNNSLIPLYGKLKLDSEKDIKKIISLTTYYIFVVISIGLLIILSADIFVSYLIDEDYRTSIIVIPWVVIGFVFMAFYLTQINLLTITLGRTKLIGIATTVAAVINITLNIIAVPIYGIVGAALTTALTYLVLFIGVLYFSRRYFVIEFEFKRFGKILLASALVFWINSLVQVDNIYYDILSIFIFMIVFIVILFLTGFLTQKEKSFIKNRLKL